jgi:hypothetical protein
MPAPYVQSLHLPLRIASLAAGVLCAAGLAASVEWSHPSIETRGEGGAVESHGAVPLPGSDEPSEVPQTSGTIASAVRCPECGVVESMQEIASPSEAIYRDGCQSHRGEAADAAARTHEEEIIDIATLVAWHVYALTGLGCDDGRTPVPSMRRSSTTHYEIIVLFRDGSRRAIREVVNESRAPSWRLRDRVKVMSEMIL